MSEKKEYLVVDNGGTFIKYARMQEDGTILVEGSVATPAMTAPLEDYMVILDRLMAEHGQGVAGLAFSMPGNIDVETGTCVTAGALVYLTGYSLKEELEARYGVPVTVENDGKCAVLAEYWKGSLVGVKNGAAFVLGTGIGGGLILNGQLFRGEHFSAGEFSFKVANVEKIKEHGGYYSSHASVAGLCYQLAQACGMDSQKIDGKRVLQMVEEGHGQAMTLWKKYVQAVAACIYDVQCVLDVRRFALGGGISQNERLLPDVQAALSRMFDKHPFRKYGLAVRQPEVVCCQFYNEANLQGALYHHLVESGTI